jgi:homoserine O-acetyltransferase/O-succinyltransferase
MIMYPYEANPLPADNGLQIFRHPYPFPLESGAVLPEIQLAYHTYGELDAARDNVVWVFHALTANSNPVDWWPELTGYGKVLDPGKYFIICVNMPGSCYGSSGPLAINPQTAQPYYHRFPFFTTRDMIRAYQLLKNTLQIKKIFLGIGGSMGGQQLLEWAVEEPALFTHIVPLATNAVHSPWGIAYNTAQRLCIEADTTWLQPHAQAGIQGMRAARSVALLSYRHYDTYGVKQQEHVNDKLEGFNSESYQHHQGEKLARRFNAYSYYTLSKSMDAHNLGRTRGSVHAALKKISAKTTVISISTDNLFPPPEQQFLAAQIPGAKYHSLHSLYGHDGFLLEYESISGILQQSIPGMTTGNTQKSFLPQPNTI